MTERVSLALAEPPRLRNLGVSTHGTGGRLVDRFRLPDLWQLHLYRYDAELTVDGARHRIRPGRVSLIPAGATSQYIYTGPSEHLYVHFRPTATVAGQPIPVIQDGGAEVPVLTALLSSAIAVWPTSPARATAEVWAALHRIAALGEPGGGRTHPAVAAAMAHIESHLAATLEVPRIAAAVGVSHNHLTRLFRAETGDTVVAYIRHRRMHRARHLLRESTLPIPTVAAAVGIPDLQAFNKVCRRELGAAPRVLRA
ncbi:AraC family transcriptional regulator [Phytomonospora sp. NPDC050363]|uniref:AraC family transcriptional regulator n=1 Tax=Phytomonospora sp. NPDC050363 TaxID=3155642 RepID=UPI0033FC06B6